MGTVLIARSEILWERGSYQCNAQFESTDDIEEEDAKNNNFLMYF